MSQTERTCRKRCLPLALLTALTLLNTACAEEADAPKSVTAPAESSVAPNTAPAEDKSVIAKNTPAETAPGRSKGSGAAVRETGSTRSAVQLMSTPHTDAKPAGQLAANSPVDILERRGGWLRISGQGKTGWAKLHQVRVGQAPGTKKSGEGLAILKNVGETGRSGSQGIVATTGIRGMSAEELKNAKPDPEAVKIIERYAVNANQARDFAREAGLKERDVGSLSKAP